jgi:hypothetical protein
LDIVAPSLHALEEHRAAGELVRLYRYWLDKRGGRPTPARADINPLEFSFAIGRVSLIDVVAGPRRFRYRLVSTAITNRLGYELTNKFTSDIQDDDTRRYVEDLYGRVLDARLPLFEKNTRIFDNKLWQHEALVLPLAADGERIDMLMSYRWTFDPAPLPRWAQI